jgi:hypothetical protein
MLSFSTAKKAPFGIWALIGLMLVTRFHHFGSSIFLPDASLAVFFMAGLWFGGLRLFAILFIEATLIDAVAISQFNVSDYCISPAYLFLIPTYAALSFAGQIAARFKILSVHHLAMQLSLLVGATSVAFLISNGSFYALSDRYPDLSWAHYAARVVQYYPLYLSSTLVYSLVIIGAVKLIVALLLERSVHNKAI